MFGLGVGLLGLGAGLLGLGVGLLGSGVGLFGSGVGLLDSLLDTGGLIRVRQGLHEGFIKGAKEWVGWGGE